MFLPCMMMTVTSLQRIGTHLKTCEERNTWPTLMVSGEVPATSLRLTPVAMGSCSEKILPLLAMNTRLGLAKPFCGKDKQWAVSPHLRLLDVLPHTLRYPATGDRQRLHRQILLQAPHAAAIYHGTAAICLCYVSRFFTKDMSAACHSTNGTRHVQAQRHLQDIGVPRAACEVRPSV
jgi:hypothetical protein